MAKKFVTEQPRQHNHSREDKEWQ